MSRTTQESAQQLSGRDRTEPEPDSLSEPKPSPARPLSVIQTLVWIAVFASLYSGYAWWQTGSASLVLPYLQGERLLLQPANIDLGAQLVNTTVDLSVNVVNATGSDVDFLGAQKSCGCISLDVFPLTVEDGQSRELKVSVATPRRPGPFEQSVKFFTDYDSPSAFAVTVTANVQ